MAEMQPYSQYTPTRTADGAGGWTDTLGTATTLWGAVVVHENDTRVAVDIRQTVTPDDVLLIDGAYYRVVRVLRHLNAGLQECTLDRIERPIEP